MNRTDKDRVALQFAYTPMWVLPMGDQASLAEEWLATKSELSDREATDLSSLIGDDNAHADRWCVVRVSNRDTSCCCHPLPGHHSVVHSLTGCNEHS